MSEMQAVCAHTHCCVMDHVCSAGNNFGTCWAFKDPVKTGGRVTGVVSISQNHLRETEVPNRILLTVWAGSLGESQLFCSDGASESQKLDEQCQLVDSFATWNCALHSEQHLQSSCRSSVLLDPAPHQLPAYIFVFFLSFCWFRQCTVQASQMFCLLSSSAYGLCLCQCWYLGFFLGYHWGEWSNPVSSNFKAT